MTSLKLWEYLTLRTPLQPSESWKKAQSTQGMPLDHLALVAKRACISEPHRTTTIGKTVMCRVAHQGIAQTID